MSLMHLPIRYHAREKSENHRCYLYLLEGTEWKSFHRPNLGLLTLELDNLGKVVSVCCCEQPTAGRKAQGYWIASVLGKNRGVTGIGTHTAYQLIQEKHESLSRLAIHGLWVMIYEMWYLSQKPRWHLRLCAVISGLFPSNLSKAIEGLNGTVVMNTTKLQFEKFTAEILKPINSRTKLRRVLATYYTDTISSWFRGILQIIPHAMSRNYLLWRQGKALLWFSATVGYQVQEPPAFELVLRLTRYIDFERIMGASLRKAGEKLGTPSHIIWDALASRFLEEKESKGSIPYYETKFRVSQS